MIKKLYNSVRNVYIRLFKNGVRLSRKSTVISTKLGNYAHVGDYAFVYESELGRYTSIGRNSVIRNAKIGDFCSISWLATVGATPHDYTLMSTHAFHYISSFDFVGHDKRIVSNTIVGNDVWVGANAVIMPGLRIGDGAVIGAGAVVTKDVPAYAIVAGIPAVVITSRFEKDVIEKLMDIKWWNWDIEKIQMNISLFRKSITIDGLSQIRDK